VAVLAHSLEAAYAAEQDGAAPTLIAAAVLHDYGHLIHGLPEDCADQGIDSLHEQLGAAFLVRYFVPAVTEPVRLHVAAKRYLCAVDAPSLAALSPASAQRLRLPGGAVTGFEAARDFMDAVRLRRYDDIGKDPEAWTPDLEHYREVLESTLLT